MVDSQRVKKMANFLFGKKNGKVLDYPAVRSALHELETGEDAENKELFPDPDLLGAINEYAASIAPPHLMERMRFGSLLALGVVVDQYMDFMLDGLEKERPFTEVDEDAPLGSSESDVDVSGEDSGDGDTDDDDDI
ncbi:hypothetical protein P9112_000421 [Eukaryota sp. TZLM1-RC]